MRYHVFIDGCRDVTPEGVERLAAALAQRYGMSPPAVKRRLKEGRFCARASLDHASAERLVGELEALGAHTSLVGEDPRVQGDETQAKASAPGAARYESGLAAAFSGGDLRGDVGLELGALAAHPHQGAADASWQLADVDGSGGDETGRANRPPPHPTNVTLPFPALTKRRPMGPPPPPSPASLSAARRPTATPTPERVASPASELHALSSEGASDPFQPPDAEGDTQLELAEVPLHDPAPPPTSPAALAASSSEVVWRPVAPISVAGSESVHGPGMLSGLRETMARSARARFVAGVALAFLVGLVPAEIYSWSRAASAYDDIRADLQADYDAADTPERWASLATAREGAVERALARQQRLAVSTCLLWLVAGGATAFVWFRFFDRGLPAAPR